MADELDPLFGSLKRVTAVLTDPATLRATAERRTAMRRVAVGGVTAVAVILALVATGLSLRHNASIPVPPGASATPGTAATPSDTATPSAPATPSGSAAPAGVRVCTPSDFDPQPRDGWDGAMGNAYHIVAVHNISRFPCTVTESPILIGVNERSGKTERIPMEDDSSTELVTIPAGQWGYFVVHTVNGLAGYDPSDPQCANPRSYRDVVLDLDGSHFALRGISQGWRCGNAQAIGWKVTGDIAALDLEVPK